MRGMSLWFVMSAALAAAGCSGASSSEAAGTGGGSSASGGSANSGGMGTITSGVGTTGGAGNSGGRSTTGGTTSANTNLGGSVPVGGTSSLGSAQNTGGLSNTGGSKSTGGTKGTGGTKSTGGAQSATGGQQASGGSTGGSSSAPAGGTSNAGGTSANGGRSSTGETSSGGGTSSQSIGGSGGTGGSTATGGAASVDCTDTATQSGTFNVRYDAAEIAVTGKQKSYIAHTNWWHKYNSQTISYNGLSFKISDPQNTSVPASDGAPTGFPSMFIGSYSGNASKGSNLPKLVSSLTSVPTIFSTDSLAHDTSNFNATYDVWFTASSSPLPANASDPGADGALLMVWLFKPSDRQPRGGKCGSTGGCEPDVASHTVAGVSQATWDVWLGAGNGRAPCVSYVSTAPLDSLSFDLNKFIQDAVANNYYVKSAMNLSIVFAGFEIWGGGDGVQVKQYCAQVN